MDNFLTWRARVTPSTVGKFIPRFSALDIALGTVLPKDRANVLLGTLAGQGRIPWERLDVLQFRNKLEAFKNDARASLKVEGINMETIDACFSELADKFDSQVDTVFLDRSVVVLDGFEIIPDLLRNVVVAERDDTLQTIVVLDGENTGEDRAFDANSTASFDELDENVGVKEELGNYKISASVDLFLETSQIVFLVRVVDVTLGVTCK